MKPYPHSNWPFYILWKRDAIKATITNKSKFKRFRAICSKNAQSQPKHTFGWNILDFFFFKLFTDSTTTANLLWMRARSLLFAWKYVFFHIFADPLWTSQTWTYTYKPDDFIIVSNFIKVFRFIAGVVSSCSCTDFKLTVIRSTTSPDLTSPNYFYLVLIKPFS